MNYCQHCGEKVNVDMTFCPKCGKRLATLSSENMRTVYSTSNAYAKPNVSRRPPAYVLNVLCIVFSFIAFVSALVAIFVSYYLNTAVGLGLIGDATSLCIVCIIFTAICLAKRRNTLHYSGCNLASLIFACIAFAALSASLICLLAAAGAPSASAMLTMWNVCLSLLIVSNVSLLILGICSSVSITK